MSIKWYPVWTYAGQEEKVKQQMELRVRKAAMESRILQIEVLTEDNTELFDEQNLWDLYGEENRAFLKYPFYRAYNPYDSRPRRPRPSASNYILVEMELNDETRNFISQQVGVMWPRKDSNCSILSCMGCLGAGFALMICCAWESLMQQFWPSYAIPGLYFILALPAGACAAIICFLMIDQTNRKKKKE